MRSTALTVGVVVLSAASGLEGQSVEQKLEGAWRVTEVVTTGPRAGTLGTPQPGLLLFAGGHYSYTLITGDEPRPLLPRGLATMDEVLAVWSPFTANAGTFEVSGNRMTRRPIVSKGSDAMAPGAFNEYTFLLSADTLWVTTVGTEGGPARDPTTVKFVRAG